MSDRSISDLQVGFISDALTGKSFDLIISGSIGAVESVRFIRSLRRLGAKVRPWMTKGAEMFTTSTAVSWASDHEVITGFSGTTSHLASGHNALIIAPASANMIAKTAHGITDTPQSALVASYLGSKKPVYLLPNMHESLMNSPAIQENLAKINNWLTILSPRSEEGKIKFPEPRILADQIAHLINLKPSTDKTLINMGSTKGYIDDIRYISNYSSGKLGSLICEELYRNGVETYIAAGSSIVKPKTFHTLKKTETNSEMIKALKEFSSSGAHKSIFIASVLDYIPSETTSGKIRSGKTEGLSLQLKSTDKIISQINSGEPVRIAFKLEPDLNLEKAKAIAEDYMKRYQLSLFVVNSIQDVSKDRHKAWVFEKDKMPVIMESKESIARAVTQHVIRT